MLLHTRGLIDALLNILLYMSYDCLLNVASGISNAIFEHMMLCVHLRYVMGFIHIQQLTTWTVI